MKYIRTKDGIYEVKRKQTLCGINFYDIETQYNFNRIREEKIINQADTIEELCDEFVIIDKEGNVEIITYGKSWSLEYIKETLEDFITDKSIIGIYGAVWTSKGLQYVAKMNKKGVLELI